jgi:hypothetical protein
MNTPDNTQYGRPYLFTFRDGKAFWYVNQYWYDFDHWAKYSNHPFTTKAKAEAFVAAKIAAGFTVR